MLRNLMAKLGKGGANVDLVLDKQEYQPGDTVSGELVVQGGTVEQSINRIDVELSMSVRVGDKEYTKELKRFPFPNSFVINPSENKVFPFNYQLPNDLPLSGNQIHYTFVTHLDIASGKDHYDRDPIRINPPDPLQKVLDAFSQLGFREKHDSRSFNGYVQEFEFFPTSFLKDQAKEVEFACAYEENGIRLMLEVDLLPPTRGHEVRREVSLDHDLLNQPEELTEKLQSLLQEMVNDPEPFTHPKLALGHQEHKHSGFSKVGGVVGGLAAGLLGGMILSEIIDHFSDDDEVEAAEPEEEGSLFDGMFEGDNGEENEEEGSFFDNMFGGDDSGDDGGDEGSFFDDLFDGDDE